MNKLGQSKNRKIKSDFVYVDLTNRKKRCGRVEAIYSRNAPRTLTMGRDPEFQQIHERMTAFYTEVEVAEIAAIVINMNVWTSLKLAQGETPVFA